MSRLPGFRTRLANTCGAFLAHSFNTHSNAYGDANPNDQQEYVRSAGWVLAGFINDVSCKKAYQAWSSKYAIVWQSPVRINYNTNRQFFIAIFDTFSQKD